MPGMNKLNRDRRVQILSLLCEGMSLRAVTRVTGASINTVTGLLVTAGKACSEYQDRAFRNLQCRRLQVDELWAFCYAKQKNVASATAAPDQAGDLWTWVAIDADTKLVPSWLVGARDGDAAKVFMTDLASRLANRVQLASDGHVAYLEAVYGAFRGTGIDYAQLVKIYGPAPEPAGRYSPAECVGAKKQRIAGKPDMKHVSTSYAERVNLTIRMHTRRLTRLTNAFTKKAENHAHAIALHFMYYNLCRIHATLRCTPAMAAGVTSGLWDVRDIVRVVEDWEARQEKMAAV
jgi:IS1 family transposase